MKNNLIILTTVVLGLSSVGAFAHADSRREAKPTIQNVAKGLCDIDSLVIESGAQRSEMTDKETKTCTSENLATGSKLDPNDVADFASSLYWASGSEFRDQIFSLADEASTLATDANRAALDANDQALMGQ